MLDRGPRDGKGRPECEGYGRILLTCPSLFSMGDADTAAVKAARIATAE